MRKGFRINHTKRMWIYFILCSMIPVVIVMATLTLSLKSNMERDVEEQKRTELSYIEQSFNDQMRQYCASVDQILESEEIYEFLEYRTEDDYYALNQQIYLLFGTQKSNCKLHVVSCKEDVFAGTGTTYADYRYPANNRNWGAFRDENKSLYRYVYVNDLHNNEMNNTMFSFISPVYSEEELLGYVILDVEIYTLRSIVVGASSENSAPVYLFSDTGFVVFSSNESVSRGRSGLPDYILDPGISSGRDIEVLYSENEMTGLTFACEVPLYISGQALRLILPSAILLLAIVLVLSIGFAYMMAKHITEPVRSSMDAIHEIEKGNFDVQVKVTANDEIGEMMKAINNMAVQLKELIHRVEEKQETLRVAEMRNLRNQLKPHLLYNVLDMIRWKAHEGKVQEVDRIIVQLARILRASIDAGDGMYTVEEEIAFISDFVELNKVIRPKLRLETYVDPEMLEMKIPRLLLQPLVENSIKHGIGDREEGGTITLTGRIEEGSICFEVSDDGEGISAEKLEELENGNVCGNSVGLSNVRNRIRLHGGPESRMEITSSPGKGTRIHIVIERGPELWI